MFCLSFEQFKRAVSESFPGQKHLFVFSEDDDGCGYGASGYVNGDLGLRLFDGDVSEISCCRVVVSYSIYAVDSPWSMAIEYDFADIDAKEGAPPRLNLEIISKALLRRNFELA